MGGERFKTKTPNFEVNKQGRSITTVGGVNKQKCVLKEGGGALTSTLAPPVLQSDHCLGQMGGNYAITKEFMKYSGVNGETVLGGFQMGKPLLKKQ
jgi:hypothetical protein